MRKYINFDEFDKLLSKIEMDQTVTVYTEDAYKEVEEYHFLRMRFNNQDIILYDHPCGAVGILQDSSGIISYDDMIEGLWEDLENNGECTIFINVTN